MTEREALKLAQKAMGLIGADLVCDAAHHEKKDRHQIGEPCPIQARWHQAFAAIKESLAHPPEERNFCPRCGKRAGKNDWDVHTCSLPEPEQEPVARVVNKSVVFRPCDLAGLPLNAPLYITQPQREWQGLTDEEIFNSIRPLYRDDKTALSAIRITKDEYLAIEAALKEKNA